MGGTELHLKIEIPQQANQPHPFSSKRDAAIIYVGGAGAGVGAVTVLVIAVSATSSVPLGVGVFWWRVRGGGAAAVPGSGRGTRERPDLYHIEVEVLPLVLWLSGCSS